MSKPEQTQQDHAPAVDAGFTLRREAEAAKRLLAMLQDAGNADDAQLVADTIEGETSLHDALAAALDQIDETEALVAGLKAKEDAFAVRRKAMEARIERLAGSIELALITSEQRRISLPSATLFLSKRAPKLVVETEADIPSRFFTAPEPPAPKLDKRAVKAALDAGEKVPGASLDNGSQSLTIRRS